MEETFRLWLHPNRGNVYALVRPDGPFHLTLESEGGRVRGRAIRYWSQLSTSAAGTLPFLSFEESVEASGERPPRQPG